METQTKSQPIAILIGMPASGKTRVGKELAATLETDFLDLDEEIEKAFDEKIRTLFEKGLENKFREKESELFQKYVQSFSGVLSVGGGAISENNAKSSEILETYLECGGEVIWLDVRSEIAVNRILKKHLENNQTRPMFEIKEKLSENDAKQEIQKRWEKLLKDRKNHYSEIASLTIPIDFDENEINPDENISQKIAEQIKAFLSARKIVITNNPNKSTIYLKNGFSEIEKEIMFSSSMKNAKKVIIITTKSVEKYANEIAKTLDLIGKETLIHFVPDAENGKTVEVWANALEEMAKFKMTRTDHLLAIGGGAVTDLGGFLAASYLRGIEYSSIPTTLLAQVDAAIGGKTGINLASGKNLVGAFHLPKTVICDSKYLKTLQKREMIEGLAEALKMGIVFDQKIIDIAEELQNYPKLTDEDFEKLTEIIYLSSLKKAEIVEADFRETVKSGRIFLNYGHTFGHAIEKIENFKIRHGEAVAIGMVYAAKLSSLKNLVSEEFVNKHISLLSKFGLPVKWETNATFEEVYNIMQIDKKAEGSTIRFVGMKEKSQGGFAPIIIDNYTVDELRTAFEYVTQ